MHRLLRFTLRNCIPGILFAVAFAHGMDNSAHADTHPSQDAAIERLHEIHQLQASLLGRDASDDEKARLQRLVDELHSSGAARLLDNVLDTREDHQKGINLPVYPQSKLLMHAPAGIDMTFQGQLVYSLPIASFLTTDSPEAVRDYYLEQLDGYELITGEPPGNYQILADRQATDQQIDAPVSFITPNVRIRPTDSRLGTHLEGARSLIHLYYPVPAL